MRNLNHKIQNSKLHNEEKNRIYAIGNAGGNGINPAPVNTNFLSPRFNISTDPNYALIGGLRITGQLGVVENVGSPYTFDITPDSFGVRGAIPADSPFGDPSSSISANGDIKQVYTQSIEGDVLNGLVTRTGWDVGTNLFTPWVATATQRTNIRINESTSLNVRVTLEYSARPDRLALVAVGSSLVAGAGYAAPLVPALPDIWRTISQPSPGCPVGAG